MHATGWTLFLTAAIFAEPLSPELSGTVLNPDGKPLAGARVDISTAAPRVGRGLFCPSCYVDCAKRTRTDELGRFEFTGLDPSLKFRLLISAVGLRTVQTELIDPIEDDVEIKLQAAPQDFPPEHTIRGQIVNDVDQPVEGALVDPCGAKTADRRWGGRVAVAPTITDAEGRFALRLPNDYLALDIEIVADGYAGASKSQLEPGTELHRLVIPAGTGVTGRLLRDGQPAAGVRVAVVQMNRSAGHHFIKAVGDITGRDGRYRFDYLPANQQYAIFTLVGEGPQELVLKTRKFNVHADRATRELPDLELVPALRISGKIIVPANEPIPADTKVIVGRDPAWDLIAVPAQEDGTFVIEGLPPEIYTIQIVAKGFSLDTENLPYQVVQENTFGIALVESLDELNISLKKSP